MSKVEEVARALCRMYILGAFRGGKPELLDEIVSEDWPEYSDHARAAIAAMREPSEAMVRTGAPEVGGWYEMERRAHCAWLKMIDAALQE